MGINQLRPIGIDLSPEGWTSFLATGVEFINGNRTGLLRQRSHRRVGSILTSARFA
jgi:hypothetical protein